uniref:Uncharacterized protein n=1 Tax=Triticum urartu TaxID=4572 RepID=A0A8R7TG14_TRIUA
MGKHPTLKQRPKNTSSQKAKEAYAFGRVHHLPASKRSAQPLISSCPSPSCRSAGTPPRAAMRPPRRSGSPLWWGRPPRRLG